VQAAVAAGVFFLLGQLRVDKEENQDERRTVYIRGPQIRRARHGEIDEEDPGESGDERHVSLVAELRDLAQQTVLESTRPKAPQATAMLAGCDCNSYQRSRPPIADAAQE